MLSGGGGGRENLIDTHNIVAKGAQEFNGTGRDMRVGQESHVTTEVFSLASFPGSPLQMSASSCVCESVSGLNVLTPSVWAA